MPLTAEAGNRSELILTAKLAHAGRHAVNDWERCGATTRGLLGSCGKIQPPLDYFNTLKQSFFAV